MSESGVAPRALLHRGMAVPRPSIDTVRCLWAGTGASALVVAGGVLVGPGAAPHGRVVSGVGYIAAYAGVLGLVGAWVWLGRLLTRCPGPSRGIVLAALAVWGLPLLCGPILYSRDIFSYAAHGREIVVGINPYHHGPAALGGGQYLRPVSSTWSDARSPYGPFFLALDALIVRISGPHAMMAVALLRLLSCAGVILLAVALSRLASSYGADPGLALWLGVLNPLMLLHVVSGGHNEGLMLGLMTAGLVCARKQRFAAGLVLCVLAAGVKVPAALGAVYVGAEWIGSCPDRSARARAAVRMAATAVATALSVTVAAGLGWGWIWVITTPTRVRTALSLTTDVGSLAGKVIGGLGRPVPAAWAMPAARLAGVAVAVTMGAILLASRHRRPSAVGIGLTLLAVAALGPVIQPWYVLWGLVPLAAVASTRLRPALVWTSAGLCFLVLPNGSAVADVFQVAFLATTAIVFVVGGRERSPVASLTPV